MTFVKTVHPTWELRAPHWYLMEGQEIYVRKEYNGSHFDEGFHGLKGQGS